MKGWLTTEPLDIFIFQGHGNSVNHCAINLQGDRVVSASDDRTLKVWTVPAITGERLSDEEEYSFGIYGCAIDSSGDWAISVELSGELKRWNLHQMDAQNILTHSADGFAKCVISPNGRWIATTSGRQSVILTLWDALTGAEVLSFQGHTKTINSCAISPDNTWVVTASDDQTLKIWDTNTGKHKFTLSGHTEAVNSCTISANGKWVLSASSDRTLKIWDAQTGTLLQTLQGHQDKVRDCAITPDGGAILSGSDDGTLRLWKISALEETHDLFKYANRVERCVISPDGKLFLSLTGTQMKLWSLSTEHCLTTFYSHQPLFDCAFHPDGYHFAVAAEDGLYFFTFSSPT